MANPLKIEPVDATFGAVVTGLRIPEVDDETFRALHDAWLEYALLIFPGEGHSLDKNPWHGKIKVREELKWLQKYGGVPAGN